MHTLASFRLDHTSDSTDQAIKRFEGTSKLVEKWLAEKGVLPPFADQGKFNSNTEGQEGHYLRSLVANDEGTIEETVLAEPISSGQIFTTRIVLVRRSHENHVFCTLNIQNRTTVIAPTRIFPRCPGVLKEIAKSQEGWRIGEDLAPTKLDTASSEVLIADILSLNRCVPVVVVSELEGQTIWPRLADDIAFDLICLARVYRSSTEVSWELTERLGKADSCYLGAVRVYWPQRSGSENHTCPPSRLWTAYQMLSTDTDGKGPQRFRTTLRNLILSVSARTVEPPAAIRTIYIHERQAKLRELEAKADSKSEELEIARSYLDDNEQLRARISELEGEVASLQGRALAAEHALGNKKDDEDVSIEPIEEALPVAGEIRYYKKIHSTPGYDVLVRVKGCDHNSWQSANKADKAKKGIERLEGRSDWSKLNHCGKCTGGGLWRVSW